MNTIEYIEIRRTYLEMTQKPANTSVSFPPGIEIKEFDSDCAGYRRLNGSVGGDLGWVDRMIMSDGELNSIISHQDNKIFVMYHETMAIGYCEIDFRDKKEVSLDYFGLIPDYRGKGLGKLFLQWTIREAWKQSPLKFKLNTCERDHPNALCNYLKAGFKITEERIVKQAIINVTG
jgi:GNAT superfamily N-acetyltransferase